MEKHSPSHLVDTQAGSPSGPAAASDWVPGTKAPAGIPAAAHTPQPAPEAADKRVLDRYPHLELGKIVLSIKLAGTNEWMAATLQDFNSIGFGILLPAPAGPDHPFRPGEELELCIQVGARQEFQVWCSIKNVSSHAGGMRIGLRRLDIGFPQAVKLERREALRLSLSPTLSLKACVRHPLLYGHWTLLQVSDLNQDMGLSFLCKDPSLLLFEGMELQIRFELASFRKLPLTARVAWVYATREDEVRFGVSCVDMDYRLHNGLCDFLLFSQIWTPARLREAGFQAQRVKGHLRFRSVKSMEDYAEVLYLRRDAYVLAGRKPAGTAPEDMAGPLDGKSRILMAHHRGRLVGSLTFSFPPGEDTVLDSESGFPGQKYPVGIPPKTNLIEVSRLCTHVDYRGTDLLQGLFEHGLKHFLMSDRHWLLTSAVDELLPLYEKIGFVRLKASYKHPRLGNQEHHLIIANRNAFLWGFGINVLVWNITFGNLIRYLLERQLVTLPGWMRAVIRCKLAFQPLARLLLDGRSRRAFRRHLDVIRNRAAAEPEASPEAEG